MTDNITWPDLAGRFDGKRHILPVRVYFEDTDFTGLVYHASYIRWCERGRSDFVRLLGLDHNRLMSPQDGSDPSAFVVRHLEADYLRPAKIDDILEVITECAEIGGAYLSLAQKIVRNEDILIKVKVKVVLINDKGKPLRIGALATDALDQLKNLQI